ncbi:MAG: adenylate/guanylate cyclase domain-containing protein [Burkholderiales bacterium]|nr:adenylate/guanylate cyclase domain-containing protein [Burkholderiales bacterium]
MLRRRLRFATIAVSGAGALVAAAVGATLAVSGGAGLRSAQTLLAEQAETLLDRLEERIEQSLAPVREQSAWIAAAFAEGRLDLERRDLLDAFMRGAVGALPQVSTVSLADVRGRLRRWSREEPARGEDRRAGPETLEWLERGRALAAPGWLPPLWATSEMAAALAYETPLRGPGGRYLGVLGQVVPVARLSAELAAFGAEHRVTAFVLFGEDRVLAHPALAGASGARPRVGPLPSIAEVGDPVLDAWERAALAAPLALRALRRSQGATAVVRGTRYLYVVRDVPGTGVTPWKLGVYQTARESPEQAEIRRLLLALAAGLAVLVAAVAAAAFTGRWLARPVEEFARAARTVRAGKLDAVPKLPRSVIREFDEASRSFNEMVEGLRERTLIRETLGRLVPEEVARRMLAAGGRIEPVEAKATVLLADIEDFTQLTETLGPRGVVAFLNAYFEVADDIVRRHRGVITQFQGDAVLAVFNLPIADPDHGANALRAALELIRAADERDFAGVRVRNRAGLATGRVVAGAVGSAGRTSYTVHGNAVNLAARIEALNKDYGTRILLAEKTAERCSGFALVKVADARIRGYGEVVPLYSVARSGAG